MRSETASGPGDADTKLGIEALLTQDPARHKRPGKAVRLERIPAGGYVDKTGYGLGLFAVNTLVR